MTRAALAVALLVGGRAAAAPLGALERTGRAIYVEGRGVGGRELAARIGDGAPLPGGAVRCASCHGADGRGRAEGGVVPPDVTWRELAKPYGHVHDGGRRHPAFDAAALARAVGQGVDPAGNRLDLAMPRYDLRDDEVAALAAYLRVVDVDRDPGLSADAVRVGAVVPESGSAAEAGRAVRALLQASVDRVNDAGGVHGRRLELRIATFPPGGAAAAARRLLHGDSVFALVGGLAPGEEEALAAVAEEERVPLIAPWTASPPDAAAENAHAFYLVGGLREQARALAVRAARDVAAPGRAVVVHGAAPALRAAADAAAAQLRREGWTQVRVVPVEALSPERERGAEVVLFLADGDALAALGRAARTAGWAPRVLAPGALVGRAAAELPPELPVQLAFPLGPGDARRGDELARVRERAGVRAAPSPAHAASFAAVALLVEGLRRAGRDLDRAALEARLEALYDFDSGALPPLRYGPARRVGALGAHVVAVDARTRAFRPIGWVALDEEGTR